MRPAMKFIIFLFILAGLISCGFKPRGELLLAPPLHNVYLKTSDPYGELAHEVRQYLKFSGVHLADSPKEATSILDILHETKSQQLLSVGGTEQTRQYNLTLSVTFQVTDPAGAVLVIPTTVSEARVIPIQSNQILGGSNEANMLYRLMRQNVVYSMMNRLASQEVSKLLTGEHKEVKKTEETKEPES